MQSSMYAVFDKLDTSIKLLATGYISSLDNCLQIISNNGDTKNNPG